jgi:hypothetical protein
MARLSGEEGSQPPLWAFDQTQAAAAQAAAQEERLVARGGRRRQDPPPALDALFDAYTHACEHARTIYEQEVPRSQWLAGYASWIGCDHLHPGPAPMHWHPRDPEIRVCTDCWEALRPTDTTSALCGRHDHNLTHISCAAAQGSLVTLHVAVCDNCYPQGADTPHLAD